MPKHVVFLYRGYPDKVTQLAQNNIDGLFIRPGTVLVGIDTTKLDIAVRQTLVKDYSLLEFEVDQEKFHSIIENMPAGSRITNIELPCVEEHVEILDEWEEALNEQDVGKISKIVKECWDAGHDVKALEYYFENSRIRYTSLAELDISSSSSDVQYIMNTYPIGVLSGVLREDIIDA